MGRISIISAKDNSLYIHGEAVLSLLISSAIEMEFSLFKKKTDSHLSIILDKAMDNIIGLRKDGQGNLLHPRSHPRCNQAAPCVCASVQPPHQTGQRCGSIGCSFFTSFKRKGPAPHGVEPFSKLFNYFKILRGSGLFIQHELSINRLLFQAFHLLAL